MEDQEVQDAVDAAAGALAATRAAVDALKQRNTDGNTIIDEDGNEDDADEDPKKPLLSESKGTKKSKDKNK